MSLKRVTDGIAYTSPGAFRHRINIVTEATTDTFGNAVAGTTVATGISAAIFEPEETSEQDKALTRIVVRDRVAMLALRVGMYVTLPSVKFRARTYQIVSISDPDATWKEKHLMCVEFIPTQCT